ncbi:uncharacterized protein AC631_05131 [Debaryomyces fabryi]|uniref:Sodium/calcium exchanger membrane region domain-containing protein n=1 Tax=Debaryomyces fabryi TaxID=58627 RepID=A0A0V1PS85_9ASCO|nr:uncharacterized protein AC631_05131 [Debaryomyces fabryi]KRZ99101.1 hypothetical protein AC631_05131 [Debaryomyces fabryi]CUM56449.1 unnamed protein product [Debaryomyces fabryi]
MRLKCIILLLGVAANASCFSYSEKGLRQFSKRDNSTCSQVLKVPAEDQCSFIERNCASETDIGRVNYLDLYYCKFPSLKSFSVVPLISCLSLFFIALGMTASDYLCPNLYTISKFLELSDNLAGLTLLAFGNGSPDVLSTYKAMSLDSGSLAISELMGAALFIITVVVGSMAVVHPFKVPRDLFIRDAGFFLGVIVLVLISLLNSYLSMANCILLIGVYAIYVVIVVLNHSFLKSKIKRRVREERSRGNYSLSRLQDNDRTDDIFLDTFDDLPTIEELNFNNIRDQDRGVMNNQYDEFMRHQTSDGIPVGTGSYGLKVLLRELSKHSNQGSISLSEMNERPITEPVISHSPQLFSDTDQPQTFPTYKPYRDDEDQPEEAENTEQTLLEQTNINQMHSERPESEPQNIAFRPKFGFKDIELIKLIAPNLLTFYDYNLTNKLYLIISFPISILLRITTPVREHSIIQMLNKLEKNLRNFPFNQSTVDDEAFDYRLDKILLTTQTFMAINLMSNVMGHHALIGLLLSIVLASLMNLNYDRKFISLKNVNYIASFIGFAISISWISLFATEIISILRTVSIIYDLSDDILGITVFALGNSIGDFISNFTIAKMGMPLMAFGACFGGPLLSLSSMGISGLLIIPRNKKHTNGYRVDISKTLVVTGLSIILSISILLIMIPRNNWIIDKKIGFILIFTWVLATTICVLFETLS